MNLIKQEYKTSCGIACVAMLTGMKYGTEKKERGSVMQKAIKLFEWEATREFLENGSRTNSKDLIALLDEFGLCGRLKKFKSWNDLEGKNILAVKYKKKEYMALDCR